VLPELKEYDDCRNVTVARKLVVGRVHQTPTIVVEWGLEETQLEMGPTQAAMQAQFAATVVERLQ
jgi:hypothetical protein